MSYPNLNLLLQAANRRQLFVGLLRVGFLALCAFLFAMLIAVALDAIFAFPVWALVLLDTGLVALMLLGLIKLMQVLRRGRFDSRRLARLLEQRLGITDNSLINAIDLRAPQDAAVSRRLADESVRRGETAARQVDLRQAIAGRPAKRAALSAGLALAGTFLAYLILPGVFARGLPRLIDPTGGHPPFTLVRFAVDVQPQPLPYGSSATITARLSGPVVPDRADVVFAGTEDEQRLPMIATDQGYRVELQRVEQPRQFYIDTPRGRSDWHSFEVQQVPILEEVWVSYQYPPHTDWAPRRHRLAGNEISALEGTRVTIEAISNFPLASANVEIFSEASSTSPQDALQLQPRDDDPRRARGDFQLTYSGRLTLRLIGHNQVPGPEHREARLIALPDRPPQVAIVSPEPIALAVEDWKVPVAVEAADDIQVTDLQLQYQRQGQPWQKLPLEIEAGDRRHSRGQAEVDLAKLQARAGDKIRLFASAEDNHPEAAQSGDSPSHVIEVISQEQYMDYLRTSYQMEQMSEEIARLNERLEQLAQQREESLQHAQTLQQQLQAGQPLDEQQTQQLDKLQQKLDEYSRQTEQLSEELNDRLKRPQLYDAERAYREQLRQLADQLAQQQTSTGQLQKSLESLTPGATPQAEDLQRLQQALQQLQQQSEPFSDQTAEQMAASQRQAEQLTQIQRMMAEAQRIQQVAQQQRQVADRLEATKEQRPPTPAAQRRSDQLARQQEQLNQQLQEATRSLREAAEEAAEDLPRTSSDACQLCDSIGQQGIAADQQQAARAARQGASRKAAQSAQQAAEKLESLAEQGPTSQGAGGEMSGDLDRGLKLSAEDIQRTLQQLARGQTVPTPGPPSGQQGGRSPGSMSRFGLHGPQPPQEAFAGRRGRQDRDSRGGDDGLFDDGRNVQAESIDATSRSFDIGTAGNMRGVPIGYRDQAEAYFRRLAEETPGPSEE